MLGALFALSLAVCGTKAQLLTDAVTEWFWLSSVTAGDYLYIQGGEYWEADFETGALQNDTIVIDLTQSWTNKTVKSSNATVQPDSMLPVRQPVLFYDEVNDVIGRYGGWPYTTYDMASTLWTFAAGTTATEWIDNTPATDNGLSAGSLGPFAPANAFTNSHFYTLGGNVFPANGGEPNMTVLPGMVVLTYETTSWVNDTADVPDQNPYRTQARAVSMPNFGDNGYLVVVGGENPPTEASFYETGSYMADMSMITLYDIANAKWYTQEATGDIPPPRSEFCAVGAASNSSDGQFFEVFVYGGSTNETFDLNNADNPGYLNVYTLSLPAFHWFQSTSTTPVRRACHTCSVIGNRQMVSIGGRLPSSVDTLGLEQDPWTSGIGVFDMTAFAWVDHYNAAAETYEQPDMVQQYYASEYTAPTFSDSTLASVFAFTPTNTSSNSSSSSSGSASSGTSSGHQSGSSDTGAIAGGVVAGVVALALVLGIWFFVRRRRRNAARRPAAPAMENKTLAEAESHPLESTPLRYEADSKARIELDALEPKPATVYELPATHEDNHGPRFG